LLLPFQLLDQVENGLTVLGRAVSLLCVPQASVQLDQLAGQGGDLRLCPVLPILYQVREEFVLHQGKEVVLEAVVGKGGVWSIILPVHGPGRNQGGLAPALRRGVYPHRPGVPGVLDDPGEEVANVLPPRSARRLPTIHGPPREKPLRLAYNGGEVVGNGLP